MYDIKTIPYHEYYLKGKKVIWFYDDSNTLAKELLINNLSVCDIQGHELWNMRDVIPYDDSCVGIDIRSDHTFYFVIFMGLGLTIDIDNFQVIKKQMTK